MNNITIELSAEDRARLDKLDELMERQLTAAPETPPEAPKAEPEKTVEPEEKEAPAPPNCGGSARHTRPDQAEGHPAHGGL